MNIITIFNYDDNYNYNTMFKIWLLQALKCKYKTKDIKKIKIITKGINNNLQYFVNKLKCDDIIIEIKEQLNLINNNNSKYNHNVGFKMYNLCKEIEPFIFVDADAIIMTDMNDVIKASKDKPFISTDHQTIKGHTDMFNFKFMNTGFLIVSDPSFLDFEKIYNAKRVFKCPGTDQFLINNYCRLINYDYTHPLIHYGWNSCGNFKKVINNEIYSDRIPEKHKIHILHYWFNYKPWITPCYIYKRLENTYILLEKILEKIKFNNFEIILNLYLDSLYDNKTYYCLDEEIYKNLKILNLKGKTIKHDNKEENIEYIYYL
jgi:hypothetical protein